MRQDHPENIKVGDSVYFIQWNDQFCLPFILKGELIEMQCYGGQSGCVPFTVNSLAEYIEEEGWEDRFSQIQWKLCVRIRYEKRYYIVYRTFRTFDQARKFLIKGAHNLTQVWEE